MDANTNKLSDEQLLNELNLLTDKQFDAFMMGYHNYKPNRLKSQEEQDLEFAKKLEEELNNESLNAEKEQERLDEQFARKIQKKLDDSKSFEYKISDSAFNARKEQERSDKKMARKLQKILDGSESFDNESSSSSSKSSSNSETDDTVDYVPCDASNVKTRIEALIEYYKENNLGDLEHILTKKGYTDPISLEFMDDPVVLSDKQTYQRQTAENLLSLNPAKSPLTPDHIFDKAVIKPNNQLSKETYVFVEDTEKKCKISLKRNYNNAFPEKKELPRKKIKR